MLLYCFQNLVLCGFIAVYWQVTIGRLDVWCVLWSWSVQKLFEVLLPSLSSLLSLNGSALLVFYMPFFLGENFSESFFVVL
jgi:hypothetical protein